MQAKYRKKGEISKIARFLQKKEKRKKEEEEETFAFEEEEEDEEEEEEDEDYEYNYEEIFEKDYELKKIPKETSWRGKTYREYKKALKYVSSDSRRSVDEPLTKKELKRIEKSLNSFTALEKRRKRKNRKYFQNDDFSTGYFNATSQWEKESEKPLVKNYKLDRMYFDNRRSIIY